MSFFISINSRHDTYVVGKNRIIQIRAVEIQGFLKEKVLIFLPTPKSSNFHRPTLFLISTIWHF